MLNYEFIILPKQGVLCCSPGFSMISFVFFFPLSIHCSLTVLYFHSLLFIHINLSGKQHCGQVILGWEKRRDTTQQTNQGEQSLLFPNVSSSPISTTYSQKGWGFMGRCKQMFHIQVWEEKMRSRGAWGANQQNTRRVRIKALFRNTEINS